MRQAGRYLPEYRALKEQHGFLTMVRTPELATEVTLQPLRRFPGLDAAILFSDILVVPEALGQPYHFRDVGGIALDFALDSADAVERLHLEGFEERLAYMPAALRLLRAELGEEKALLGFAGSPWTLATYMVEGGSSEHFSRVKALYFEDRALFERLMDVLTQAVTRLLRMQVEAGADAVQIFDSWAAACPAAHYEAMSLRWIHAVIAGLPEGTPVILYAKGMGQHHRALAATGARVLGADWTVDLPAWARELPARVAVQGNLDPVLLEGAPEVVAAETTALLKAMQERPGHILNLGHGITPRARIEGMEALLAAVEAQG